MLFSVFVPINQKSDYHPNENYPIIIPHRQFTQMLVRVGAMVQTSGKTVVIIIYNFLGDSFF